MTMNFPKEVGRLDSGPGLRLLLSWWRRSLRTGDLDLVGVLATTGWANPTPQVAFEA